MGHTATSADVIRHLRRIFPDVGVPVVLSTDGGPQFASRRFAEFCKRWQVEHVKSTPHFPQSNGHAESAVKSVKSLIEKTTRNGDLDVDDFRRGLLELRNTPREHGKSPAELLFGRPLKSFVIAHRSTFAQTWHDLADLTDSSHSPCTDHYNQSARSLKPLALGVHVDIQHPSTKRWSQRGVVVALGSHRDYYVKLPSGRVYWRNRRFLRPYVPAVPTTCTQSSSASQEDSSASPPSLRRSSRQCRQYVPFNISTTRCKTYNE